MKVGDVILEVNGVPVTSPEQLQVEVAKARGDGVQLKVGSPLVDKPVMTGRQVDDSLSSESPTPSTSTEQITQTKPKFYKYNKPTTKFEGKKSLVSFTCQNSARNPLPPTQFFSRGILRRKPRKEASKLKIILLQTAIIFKLHNFFCLTSFITFERIPKRVKYIFFFLFS